MKKTIALILASAVLANADVTVHGIDFSTAPSELNQTDKNYEIAKDTASWTQNSINTYSGLYFAEGSGVKFNSTKIQNVTYLYIAPDVEIQNNEAYEAGYIRFGQGTNHGFKISSTAGAWVDIDANYSNRISLADMNQGSVYLNTYGTLSVGVLNGQGVEYTQTALTSTNVVYATALTDTSLITSDTPYTLNEDGSITRTLLSGDYSSWNNLTDIKEHVVLQGSGFDSNYEVLATSSGLAVKYNLSVPEPATATLSLLALAGLAARRRRK